MFQFPDFARICVFSYSLKGLPHSEINGSKLAYNSPSLIAESHVLHRVLMPGHPPYALSYLTILRNYQRSR